MTLEDFFARHPRTALGFSGGTDSAYLLYAGLSLGADVRPYYIKTQFQPAFELADARRLADELGVELTVIEADILADDAVAANPPDRCYHCKRALFTLLAERAASDGYSELIDGTNASDDPGDRPGTRALRELRVLSPLRECGITKADVRRLSREAGLFTYAKPSYACLATRIPAGRRIEPGDLRDIESAEAALRALGYSDLRVRLTERGARLELPESQIECAASQRAAILDILGGFGEVTLDLRGRKE
mgnify:CR=1 FL=1